MTRRALSLTFLGLAVVGLLAWLGRGGPGQDRPEGVTAPGTVDPRFVCTVAAFPELPTVGETFRLRLTINGDVALNEEEGTLLLGFPHPYYALRATGPGDPFPPAPPDAGDITARTVGGSLQSAVRRVGYGRWYVEVLLARSVAAGRTIELDIPGLRAPNRPLDRFEPLVLLDPNGDEDFWRLCPDLALEIQAGPPVQLAAVLPSRVAPGSDVLLTVRQEDAYGNPVGAVEGPYTVRWSRLHGRSAQVEASVVLDSVREGVGRATLPAPPEGSWVAGVFAGTLEAGDHPLRGSSNALVVEPDAIPIGWTDLHGHSGLADGWGTAEDWYAHARDVAVLDAAALSEHDWQLDDGELNSLLQATEAAHDPPGFVSVPALEINRLGHEIAYVFDPSLLTPSARAEGGATTLWAETDIGYPTAVLTPGLESVLTNPSVEVVTHSSLAPSMGTAFPLTKEHPNWHVIEVYSAHGSSECVDCPRSAWHEPSGDDGGWGSVRDALSAGYRLGLIAGGDSHDGRPGTSGWGAQPGGLGAVLWTERSRDGLQDALRSRRVYGTTGSRTIVDFEVDGASMGGVVKASTEHRIRFRVVDASPVRSVALVRNGIEWKTLDGAIGWQEVVDTDPEPSSWYLRAQLLDGNLAWSSPVFLE
jgi:hypothetical protein